MIHISPPYRRASRDWHPDNTVIQLPNGACFGAGEVVLIAGPCAVESEEQILETARRVRAAGATVLRGGAFKPRTSPYSFQGLGEEGLRLLTLAREETGLAVVTEVLDPESVELVAEHADILQIGARNMQNYALLRAAGRADRPVLLKRGMGASVEEMLLSAEYVLLEGESRVILCERGIRSFDSHSRNLLDLTAIPTVKELSHLPIIADPSHGTRRGGLGRSSVAHARSVRGAQLTAAVDRPGDRSGPCRARAARGRGRSLKRRPRRPPHRSPSPKPPAWRGEARISPLATSSPSASRSWLAIGARGTGSWTSWRWMGGWSPSSK